MNSIKTPTPEISIKDSTSSENILKDNRGSDAAMTEGKQSADSKKIFQSFKSQIN